MWIVVSMGGQILGCVYVVDADDGEVVRNPPDRLPLMALMAPMAVLSLQQNTADTSVLRDRSSLAPLYPPSEDRGTLTM